MNIFQENYCRICQKFFCCKVCRLEHEQNDHAVHSECNICIYGKAFSKYPSESLLQHLKAAHWPLHCVFCKHVFTSTNELKLRSTCSMVQKMSYSENSSVSIIPTSSIEPNYDSPPITDTMHKSILTSSNKHFTALNDTASLTTSTPMQKFNERKLLQNIPETITPVDYEEDKLKSVNSTKSSITPVTTEQSKTIEPALKRRVTFSETPITIHTTYDSKKVKYAPSSESHSELNVNRSAQDATSNKSALYVTASEEEFVETSEISSTQEEHQNAYNDLVDLNKDEANNDTIWNSACMDSDLINSEILSPVVHEKLLESSSLTKSNILSPVLDSDLINSEILSPIIYHNVTELDKTSSKTDMNLPKSEIISPIVYRSSMELNTGDSNFKLEILSVTVDQILKPSQILCTKADSILSKSEIPYCNDKKATYSVSGTYAASELSHDKKENVPILMEKNGLWSSMTTMFKTVMQGLSGSALATNDSKIETDRRDSKNFSSTVSHIPNGDTTESMYLDSTNLQNSDMISHNYDLELDKPVDMAPRKRFKSESDANESPARKRIKLSNIQCRRTIHPIKPIYVYKYANKRVATCDKWTQTENDLG